MSLIFVKSQLFAFIFKIGSLNYLNRILSIANPNFRGIAFSVEKNYQVRGSSEFSFQPIDEFALDVWRIPEVHVYTLSFQFQSWRSLSWDLTILDGH